jgi:hypothetical protein
MPVKGLGQAIRLAKSVSFSDEIKIRTFEEEFEVSTEERWFAGGDYVTMKLTSRSEAKEWRRHGYSFLLKETFQDPRSNAQEYMNAFVRQEGLLSRRGLERHLSRQHGEERSTAKDRARRTVLSQQWRLQRQGRKIGEIAEHIALVYEEACRTAKIFARRLGKADELGVLEGEDSSFVDSLVQEIQEQSFSKMERRLSNVSVQSGNSYDSFALRSWDKSKHPASPASPAEEYYSYAAIA